MRPAPLACAALVLAAAPGAAQQADAPPPAMARKADTLTLTLAEALRIAEGNNPAYQRAVNDVSLNRVEMRTAWLNQILPSASLRLFNTSFTGNRISLGEDDYGNPIAKEDAPWVYASRSSQALSLNWTVQGPSLLQTHQRQRVTNRTRDAQADRVLSDLNIEVQRLYWDVLEQRELTRTEEELVEARRVDLQLTERLFALAQGTRVDVLNAELQVEQQLLALQQQRAAWQRALLALRTELGAEDLPPVRLAEEQLPHFDPSRLDADALVREALDVNPELAESRLAVESAELAVREAGSSWWPELTFNVGVFRQSQGRGGEGLFDPSPGTGLDSSFGLGLSVPMFNNYFQDRQQQHQASVTLENSAQSERETRLSIEQQVRSQLLELQSQWESLRLVERALAIAEEALELRRGEYRLGTATFEELRASIEQEATSRRDLVTARHAFVDALLNLEQAVGTRVGR